MPIYNYHDKKTGYEIEVLRDFKNYEDIPTDEELPEEERGKSRDWERRIGAGVRVTKALGFGSKGNW